MPEGDYYPNCIYMQVSDHGGNLRYSELSICEGSETRLPWSGYGIHLRAENDDPTITFSFRGGRDEECHAPATDSDFSDFLGIGE